MLKDLMSMVDTMMKRVFIIQEKVINTNLSQEEITEMNMMTTSSDNMSKVMMTTTKQINNKKSFTRNGSTRKSKRNSKKMSKIHYQRKKKSRSLQELNLKKKLNNLILPLRIRIKVMQRHRNLQKRN